MTKEDKQLLLKDLCARFPYGVIVQYKGHNTIIKNKLLTGSDLDCNMEYYKPYLRPMSSMTKVERTEYLNACGNEMDNAFSSPRYGGIDYLNTYHFDYRGLIEKGLALEAPGGMYGKED